MERTFVFFKFMIIYAILFQTMHIVIVTLFGSFNGLSYFLYLCGICFIDVIIIVLYIFFSKFAYSVEIKEDSIIFYCKKKSLSFKFNECRYIFSNGSMTKFDFDNKIVWCMNADFIANKNVNILSEIINNDYFCNAKIKDISLF